MSEDKGYEQSAKYYDLFDNKPNIKFFTDFAKKYHSILDIGAGTGRIAIPIAQQGVNVICIEPSPAMRTIFQKKLEKLPHLRNKIEIIPSEAKDFHLAKLFPAAMLSGCFDHFLTPSERYESFRNIYKHLEVNGRIIFDVFLGSMKSMPWIEAGMVSVNGKIIKRYIKGECSKKNILKLTLSYQTYQNNVKISEDVQLSQAAIITIKEIEKMLSDSNFTIKNSWGNYDSKPFVEGDNILILEVEKI